MFDSVSNTYDLLNRILTWGLDEGWRKICAEECATGTVILDLCCGTGDLALLISRRASPEACIIGLDFSKAMLEKAINKRLAERQKRKKVNIALDKVDVDPRDIGFILADAAYLPFKDESIDRVGISFSFRNLIYKNPKAELCLRDVLRALRPGGKFVCVETSQPERRSLRVLYHFYLRRVVALIGGYISGRKGAYRYLGTSAANFPTAEEIADRLLSAGFRKVSYKHMTFGAVAIHTSVK